MVPLSLSLLEFCLIKNASFSVGCADYDLKAKLTTHDDYVTGFFMASYGYPVVPTAPGCEILDKGTGYIKFKQITNVDNYGYQEDCLSFLQNVTNASSVNIGQIYQCWSIDQKRTSCSGAVSMVQNLTYSSAADLVQTNCYKVKRINREVACFCIAYGFLFVCLVCAWFFILLSNEKSKKKNTGLAHGVSRTRANELSCQS